MSFALNSLQIRYHAKPGAVGNGRIVSRLRPRLVGVLDRNRSTRGRVRPVFFPARASAAPEKTLPFEDKVPSELDGEVLECPAFIDSDGEFVEAMCCDYGFRSGVMRMYSSDDGRIPKSFLALGLENFKNEYAALRRSFREDEYGIISKAATGFEVNPFKKALRGLGDLLVKSFRAADRKLEDANVLGRLDFPEAPPEVSDDSGQLINDCRQIRYKLRELKLSNEAVMTRERLREASGGKIETVWPIRVSYDILCWLLDVVFENRPIQRFWFLETVARMPYFSYISMLHLYESLGWWRAAAELRRVHFAEEWNELHHLMIMESLGGDQLWVDRFMGQHAAIVYYWVLIVIFLASPALAYNFSELIEAHAVDTYGQFVDENEALLKSLPPPLVALEYYRASDLYMFDSFQTSAAVSPRRPPCRSLYDVFSNIRDDESEHVKTMRACQDATIIRDLRGRARPESPTANLFAGKVGGNGSVPAVPGEQLETKE